MASGEHVDRLNEQTVAFEQLRAERWQHAIEIVRGARSTNELLADIANIALILYLNQQSRIKPGFRSTSETRSESTTEPGQ